MACEITYSTIRAGIIEKALQRGETASIRREGNTLLVENSKWPKKGQPFQVANSVVKNINAYFGENIASRNELADAQEIVIVPTESLIQYYLNRYATQQVAKEREILDEDGNVVEQDGEIIPPDDKPRERYSKTSEQDAKDEAFKAQVENFTTYLSRKFAVGSSVISDRSQKWAAKIQDGKAIINAAYASYSDVWHEFSHPLLISMRMTNKDLFNNLYESLKATDEWAAIRNKAEAKVKQLYPEYSNKIDDYKEEVLATALGLAAGEKTSLTAKFLNIIRQIIDWMAKLLNLDSATSLYIKEINPDMSFTNFLALIQNEDYIIRPEKGWEFFDPEAPGIPGSFVRDVYDFNQQAAQRLTPFLASKFVVSQRVYKPRRSAPGTPPIAESEYYSQLAAEQGAPPEVTAAVRGKQKRDDVYTEVESSVMQYFRELQPQQFNQEVAHHLNSLQTNNQSGNSIVSLAEQGNPVDISSDYIRKLQGDINGKTQLDKPFSSSTASAEENRILKEFYDQYTKEIQEFFKGKNIPKAIDNKRLLNKYIKWLADTYPVSWYLTKPKTMTYGLTEVIEENRQGRTPDFILGDDAYYSLHDPNDNEPSKYLKKSITNKYVSQHISEEEYLRSEQDPLAKRTEEKVLRKGYEILIANKYLLRTGHTYDLVGENGETLLLNPNAIIGFGQSEYNATGWYIYHELYGDTPLIYEYQSDVIDDLQSLAGRLGMTDPKAFVAHQLQIIENFLDRTKEKYLSSEMGEFNLYLDGITDNKYQNSVWSIPDSVPFNFHSEKHLEERLDDIYSVMDLNTKKTGISADILSYAKTINPAQRIGYLKSLLAKGKTFDDLINEDILRIEEVEFALNKVAVTDRHGNNRIVFITEEGDYRDKKAPMNLILDILGAINANKKGVVDAANSEFIRNVNASKDLQVTLYYLQQIKESGIENYNVVRERHQEIVHERINSSVALIAASVVKEYKRNTNLISQADLKKAENILREAHKKFKERALSTTADMSGADVIRQLNSMKAIQLRFFIEHSLQYAKSKGKTKVYLPTAQFIDEVESGDPWTLYVSPYDQQASQKYKDSHIGSWYEALLEVPGIEIKYTKVDGLKKPVLEVDISNFNKGVERFSKIEEKSDYLSDAYDHFTSDAIRPQVEELFKNLPSAVAKLKQIAKLQTDPVQLRRIQSLLDAYNEVKGQEKVIPVYINMMVSAAIVTRDLNSQMAAAEKMTNDLHKIYTMHSLLSSAENLQFITPLVREIVRILDTEGYDEKKLGRFVTQLRGILSVESSIKQNFIKSLTPNIQSYYSSLYPNNIIAQEIRDKIINLTTKLENSTREKDKRFYADEIKKQEKILLKIPTPESFRRVFAGQFADSSSLQMWLETSSLNSHPLIASTVSLLKDLDIAISQEMLSIENAHQRKFTGITKALSLSLRNPTKTWAPITDIVNDVVSYEEVDGKLVPTYMKRKMFVSQYLPEYLQKHFEFRNIRDYYYDKYLAARRDNNEQEEDRYYALYIDALKQRQAFEKENSERRYKDEVYDMFNLLDKEITKEDGTKTSFRKERGDIFYKIENLEHQRDSATTTEEAARHQDEIKQKYIELNEIRSTYDGNGDLKTGVPLELANIANEYYRLRYEYGENILTEEGKAAFDAEMLSLKDKLDKNLLTKEQYQAKVNDITVTKLEAEYFDKINEFSEKIGEATSKIAAIPELASTFKGINRENIKNGYKKLKDLTKAFRDANGIINGQLFSKVHPDLVKQIRDIQQEIENLKNKASKLKGLSTEDSILLSELVTKEADNSISPEERIQIEQLRKEKASRRDAYRNNKTIIDDYYKLLSGLSNLIDSSPSEYYIKETGVQLNKLIASSKKAIKDEVLRSDSLEDGEYYKSGDQWWKITGRDNTGKINAVTPIKDEENYEAIDKIVDEIALKRAQLALKEGDWWKDNHYTYYGWDEKSSSYFPQEKPIYIWTRTEPRNKEYIKAGQPSFKFLTYKVHDGTINKNKNYVNDKHKEILPYIPINKADKYVNEKYTKLDKTWKDYLEFLRQASYEAQEFYPREKKLGDLFPGIVKSSGELKVEATNKLLSAKNPIKGLMEFAFEAKEDEDTNLLLGGSQSKYYAENRVLPTRFVGKIDADKQSSDIPGMILALTLAARKYNKLLELHPILESTRTIVSNLPVQESAKLGRSMNIMNFFSPAKTKAEEKFITKDTDHSNLAKTMDFVLDTILYGQMKDSSISQILRVNVDWQKLSTGLKHWSSIAIFSFNSFVAVKNTFSAKVQGIINTNVGKGFYTDSDFWSANWETKNYIRDHFKDYKKFGDKTEIGQKLTFFQVMRGTAYNAYGQKTQYTNLKNAFNFFSIVKNISEFELQVTQFLAMSRANMVKVNGKEVQFDRAFALNKNGDLEKLPGAEVTQEQINAFIKKVGWINRNINGAYRAEERNKAQKTVLGDLAFYLNGFVMPGILNRYDNSRYSIEAEAITRGYWNQGFGFIRDLVKYRRGINTQWKDLSPEERARVFRFVRELAFIIGFAFLVGALGGGDDKKTLKKNIAFQNYMLALAMSVKSETETFAPLPSMGLNELSRKLNSPFAALKQISNIIKVLENGFGYAVHSVNSDWYQKSVYQRQGVHDGFHDPGDPKVVANFLKLIGYSGQAFDPLERVVRGRQIQQLR